MNENSIVGWGVDMSSQRIMVESYMEQTLDEGQTSPSGDG